MKNIYNEGDSSFREDKPFSGNSDLRSQTPNEKDNPANSGAQMPEGTGAAQQVPPGYIQIPYGFIPVQPNGYYYSPQGVPVQPVQLTPEQLAFLAQQYAAFPQFAQPNPFAAQGTQPFPFGQPQTEAPQEKASADSGMRILYQSPDFDSHKDKKEPSAAFVSDNFTASVRQEPVQKNKTEEKQDEKKAEEKKEAPVRNSSIEIEAREHIVIEEETISFSGRAPTAESKQEEKKEKTSATSKFSIDEMEMSTFELDSMMIKSGRPGRPRANASSEDEFEQLRPRKNAYASASFSVEEAFEETVEDAPKKKKDKKPKKKATTADLIRRIILGISLVAIIVSAGVLINEYRLSNENNELEQEISNLIIDVESTTEEEDTTKKDEDEEPEITQEPTTAPLTPEEQWAQIKEEYPNVVFPDFIQLKYARLYATNRDFVGYLEADGVGLSLPVVQGDNDDEYMEKNFYGKKTKYGCPFVTHLNNIINLDQNTIIFGHHMNNGTVFGALDKYKSIDGFKKAPVITFNTLYSDYSWKIVAAFVTNAYKEQDNGYVFRYYFTTLSTQERFAAYLNEISQRSLYDTGVDVLPTDKLLTLSTCSHEFDDARFVVVARLVRPGESTDVDVSKATVNESPRYPQAYYDKKKTDNPYQNASRWEVG